MEKNIGIFCDVKEGELVCKVKDEGRDIGRMRYDLDLKGRRTNLRIEGEELRKMISKNPHSIFDE